MLVSNDKSIAVFSIPIHAVEAIVGRLSWRFLQILEDI
jgi:hypothetical protein